MSHLISKHLLNVINLCIFFFKLLLMSLRTLIWYQPLNSAGSRSWEKGGGGGSSKPLDKWQAPHAPPLDPPLLNYQVPQPQSMF